MIYPAVAPEFDMPFFSVQIPLWDAGMLVTGQNLEMLIGDDTEITPRNCLAGTRV